MKKLGRNDTCHCGSGKKYKNCHQQIEVQKGPSNNRNILIGGVVIVIIVLAALAIFMNLQSSGTEAPGDAPEGKVWSEEHGHWHDAE